MKKICSVSFFLVLTLLMLNFGTITAKAEFEDATAAYNMGIDYYMHNDVQKSMASFSKAISLNPKFYEAYYNLGKIQSAYGYLDSAIKTYESLVELKPEDFESMFTLGNLLYKKGYLTKALSYLDRIPDYTQYYPETEQLINKITKRQNELAQETKKKTQPAAATAAVNQNVTLKPKEGEGATSSAVPIAADPFAGIPAPSGIASDSLGNVYVASFSQNTIYKINQNNQKSTFVYPTALNGPLGLAVDQNNNLYVANYNKGNILKVAPNGAAYVLYQVKKPYCINVDDKNKKLLVTEQETNSVVKFDLK